MWAHMYSPHALMQGTHNMYKDPQAFKPERFMPGGEYDQFDEDRRLFMFMPFIQVGHA